MAKKAVAVRKHQNMSEFELTNAIFAPSLILEGEDTDAYRELFKRVWDTMKPKDIIEGIYIRDYVRLTWEILRHCSHKERLIKAHVPGALEEALEPIVNGEIEDHGTEIQKIEVRAGLTPTPTQKIVRGNWCRGEPDTIKWIRQALGEAGLSMADIEARAMALVLDDLNIIDRLMAQAESRRNAILRQLEDWRDGFGRRLRGATQDVIDGEFNAVESETTLDESKAADDQCPENSCKSGE